MARERDVGGIEPIGFADGRTRLRVRSAPEHTNNLGIVHGGLICTHLDIAMGTAARCTIGLPAQGPALKPRRMC